MTTYKIAIEETIVEEFEVMANSAEEALANAEQKYHDGEFVLTSGEVQYKQMAIVEPTAEESEWVVF